MTTKDDAPCEEGITMPEMKPGWYTWCEGDGTAVGSVHYFKVIDGTPEHDDGQVYRPLCGSGTTSDYLVDDLYVVSLDVLRRVCIRCQELALKLAWLRRMQAPSRLEALAQAWEAQHAGS